MVPQHPDGTQHRGPNSRKKDMHIDFDNIMSKKDGATLRNPYGIAILFGVCRNLHASIFTSIWPLVLW